MSFHAERTKYPKVFKKCYWGTHFSDEHLSPEIIANRNELKETFDLKYCTKNMKMKISEQMKIRMDGDGNKIPRSQYKSAWFYDREWFKSHHEAYKTETGALSLFSGHVEEKLEATIKKHGYFEWKPVYALNQRTFIKII